MVFDLVAGAKQRFSLPQSSAVAARPARILVFDSGLGGLSVYPEVRRIAEGATLFYAADDAVFPYGNLTEQAVLDRMMVVMGALIEDLAPDVIVIACHTISTVVLAPLRARWPEVVFVGTVPAIKPAALASHSKYISVLATPGTVARDYTRDLIETYARDCAVTLVGARGLAALAELAMRDVRVGDESFLQEIAPAFVETAAERTDTIVLACTHYPLVLPRLVAVAPWPVTWIDPAPAIARRVERVLEERGAIPADHVDGLAPAFLTSNRRPGDAVENFMANCGLRWQHSRALTALAREAAV